MRDLHVLAIAYACNPLLGSEEGVGWGWVNAIAQNHRVTVITADYNARDVEAYRETHPAERKDNLRFLSVESKPWHYRPNGAWSRIERSLAKPLMNLAYQTWLEDAYGLAQQETARKNYDLLHLITYVGWRFPGRFYRLDLPFVWGPVGGLKNTPWHLLPTMGFEGSIYYGGRNVINFAQICLLPGPRRALRKANGAVIAATSEIQAELQKHFHSESRVICEVGVPDVKPFKLIRRVQNETLQICWSGVHLPGKALHLLLRAAAMLPQDVEYFLHILGDGPSSRKWRALASRLGMNHRCRWYGRRSRADALEVMKQSHLFVITSLKELTSTVAVEAISLGLPVVSLDHCGLADLVTRECGLKIPVQSVRRIPSDIADALALLYRNEDLRFRLAQGTLAQKAKYSWKDKMRVLDEVYQSALDMAHSASHRNNGAGSQIVCEKAPVGSNFS